MNVDRDVRTLRFLAAVLLAIPLGGCRDLSQRLWRQPRIALRAVRLSGVGLDGGTLHVSLLVHNSNFYSLNTAGMRYSLLVRDSVPIAEGSDSTHRHVPAHDSVVVELPLHVTWRGLSSAGQDIVSNGLVSYRLIGDITLDTPIGKHDVPISQAGRFAPIR
jgi:LEA14-like dessication related protein